MREVPHIGLLQLQEMIRDSLRESFCESAWISAEIGELKLNHAGHCYLTLVEKDPDTNALLSRAAAIIWSSTCRTLMPYFQSSTGRELAVGMKVLLRVQVQYSEVYGLSLIVMDIEPSFTVGEMELERQRSIERLKADGMFDMNATLQLPSLPRRFALITSETAAGFRDFMRHLHENEYGFSFTTELFSAVMQGTSCPGSIIAALDEIAARADEFDAVLLTRGGGGSSDLMCFDDYELAVNVAQFPLPVLTGIGHDHDYHIVDMVAHTNVKTPTALADFIIDLHAQEEFRVDSLSQRLRLALKSRFNAQYSVLDRISARISKAVGLRWAGEMKKVEMLELRVAAADPRKLLAKGYSMALKEGRRVDKAAQLAPGDEIQLLFEDGTVSARILEK